MRSIVEGKGCRGGNAQRHVDEPPGVTQNVFCHHTPIPRIRYSTQ
jgi:hypothetical protein